MAEQKMPSKELIKKAQECETPAKTEDIELTKEEAEAYLAQMQDVELDSESLDKVAGGKKWEPICLLYDVDVDSRQPPCLSKIR